MLWLLRLLLPCHGLGFLQRQLLEPLHVHRGAASPAAASVWYDGMHAFIAEWKMHRSSDHLHGRSAAVPPLPRLVRQHRGAHTHHVFERHQHAADDASMLALDDGPDDGLGKASSSGPGVGPLLRWLVRVRADLTQVWAQSDALRIARWAAAPPERPPRV